jgi:ABC-2 type transport system permease protein
MKIGLRRPVGVFVAVAIPLILLVIFGSVPATTRPSAALGGISFFTLYVPSLLVFILIAVGLGGLPQQLAAYREQGVLRRLSTTPVPPSWLLAAQLTVSLILAALGIAILLGVGAVAFNLAFFYPLAFFSGLYVPIQELHSAVITTIAKVLPTGAGFNALHASFLGHSPGIEPLVVLAAWAIGCSVAAARLFRWE